MLENSTLHREICNYNEAKLRLSQLIFTQIALMFTLREYLSLILLMVSVLRISER